MTEKIIERKSYGKTVRSLLFPPVHAITEKDAMTIFVICSQTNKNGKARLK
jgi:hypothetical protein